MNTENKPIMIEDNLVVTMDYELSIEGEVVDSSDENEPIIFLQGTGQIIPGLEKSIYGLKVGDKKLIIVQPKDGYGEIDPESIVEVPKDEFPDDFPLELGVEITVHTDNEEEEVEEEDVELDDDDDDEEEMEATIVAINEKTVTLDFNHPLAGKVLTFSVNILDVREATPEELEHGHAHGDDSEFYFEDEDFDEVDED
ncbi:MAG: peptidylprolyl isomerase [Anaerolineaceae bacterium]|nr:peptidylprolyl isomerase [Anaerolineaceae bacterium]